MDSKNTAEPKTYDFSKKNKVSVWVSQCNYADIPDEYFEERFSKKNTRASNAWSDNYKLKFFVPDNMETNGSEKGFIGIKKAAGQCSFSQSYIDVLMSKAKKKKVEEISWIILLFEYEYSPKLAGIEKDSITTFLGAFTYNEEADNVYDID